MTHVAVLTDSCASIPEGLLENLQIQTVAMYIHRGAEVLRDLVTIQREEFLRWMTTAQFLPTTASPGPGDYFEALFPPGKSREGGDHQHPYLLEGKRCLPGRDGSAVHDEGGVSPRPDRGGGHQECIPLPGVDGDRSCPRRSGWAFPRPGD